MACLTPAIISREFSGIKSKVAQLESLVPWVHLDVMDGEFVESTTWNNPDDLREITGQIKIEAHLMVQNPETVLPIWMANIDRAIIHFEATKQLESIIDGFSQSPVELGLALKLETPIEKIFPMVKKISVIHLMSITPLGYSGRPFDDKVLSKIKILRDQFSDVIIQVDGGIDLKTGQKVLIAGANVLIANKAVWRSKNLSQTITNFQKL